MSASGDSVCLLPADEDDPAGPELAALGLAGRVTWVSGRLTDIDRGNKVVVVSDTTPLEYDVLVICAASQDSSFRRYANIADTHPVQLWQRGVFGLGSEASDAATLDWLLGHRGARTPGIVVFGAGLNVWSTIGKLLQKGVEAERIVWVLPRAGFEDGELSHETLDEFAQA